MPISFHLKCGCITDMYTGLKNPQICCIAGFCGGFPIAVYARGWPQHGCKHQSKQGAEPCDLLCPQARILHQLFLETAKPLTRGLETLPAPCVCSGRPACSRRPVAPQQQSAQSGDRYQTSTRSGGEEWSHLPRRPAARLCVKPHLHPHEPADVGARGASPIRGPLAHRQRRLAAPPAQASQPAERLAGA